jgi:hypothetical protein
MVDLLLEGGDFKKRLEEEIREKTKEYNSILERKDTLSPTARYVLSEVERRGLFGCQRGNALRILSIVLKEDLRERRSEFPIPEGSLLVLTHNVGSHNYELEKPYLYVGQAYSLGMNRAAAGPAGGMGNNVDNRSGSYRKVKEEEMKDFFSKIRVNQLVRGVINGIDGN